MGYGSNEFNVQSPTEVREVELFVRQTRGVAVQVDPFESKL
jgi:hypothetical protein